MKNYEVMVSFEEGTRSISCRCDIDTHVNFVREGNTVKHIKKGVLINTFYILYRGNEAGAKRFRGTLELAYDGLAVPKRFIINNKVVV